MAVAVVVVKVVLLKVAHLARRWPRKVPARVVQKWFTKARQALGITDLRVHDLRHSTASAMVNSGVDLYTVGAVLGHKSAQSTRRYSHLATATLANALGQGLIPDSYKPQLEQGLMIVGANRCLFTAGTYAMIYDYQLGLAKSMNLQAADAENFADHMGAGGRAREFVSSDGSRFQG